MFSVLLYVVSRSRMATVVLGAVGVVAGTVPDRVLVQFPTSLADPKNAQGFIPPRW